MEAKTRILCVDDEPNVLEGLSLHLRRRYEIMTALSGAQGIEILERDGASTAVVMSDMRMPGMNGAVFLSRARQVVPDAVRVLLTGQADIDSAIAAVNDGQIFRFLTKPCPPAALLAAVDAAAEQHRLITAERVLLEQTLHGSISTLTETLALVSPTAFGRATRVKRHVTEFLEHLRVLDRWHIEVAAMLSQIPMVTLPPETVEKVYTGQTLNGPESIMVNRLPSIAETLFTPIPRIESVVEILRYHAKRYDGRGNPGDGISGEKIPFGARVLKLVFDFEVLLGREMPTAVVFDTLRSRMGFYDPTLLEALEEMFRRAAFTEEIVEVSLRDVRVGMRVAEEIKTVQGMVFISRGHEITPGILQRLENFATGIGIEEPLRMIVRHPKLAGPRS